MKTKLHEKRDLSGLMQIQVCDRAGLPVRTYQNYEYGIREPGVTNAIRIADALHVTSYEEFKALWQTTAGARA